MNIIKINLFSLLLNITYAILLQNIALGILLATSLQNISYYAGITLIIMFFTQELILFFSNVPSIGILILSIILAIPYYLTKKVKIAEVPTQIKNDISKISRIVPCRKKHANNKSKTINNFEY